jgi:hypothetical protein
MKTNKKTNTILSIVAVILAVIAVVLIVVSAKASIMSSRYQPPEKKPVEKNPVEKNPVIEEVQNDTNEMWFDEVFAAFYPKQIDTYYPTRAVVYGELDTKQPPFCFCSEKITNIEIFSVKNGKYDKELMKVEYLEPKETIILKVELKEQPDIGIRFKDSNGKKYSYGIARNADSSEVVLTQLAK